MKRLGIDIGSLYLGSVLLEEGGVVEVHYLEHNGDVRGVVSELLKKERYQDFEAIGVTGNFPEQEKGTFDNTLSVIEGTRFLLPGCQNVFMIGGQTFFLLRFDENGKYREHTINPPCAAGTGSFIEQQAKRLGISVLDLAHFACEHPGKAPVIATRCSVFAKTDIIHAMQEGHSLEAICCGLCEGITRNILDTLVKGRKITSPVGVVGGGALNAKIVRSLKEMSGQEVVVPQHAEVVGAIGAALLGHEKAFDFDSLFKKDRGKRPIRPPLKLALSDYPDFSSFDIQVVEDVEIFLSPEKPETGPGFFLGLDIGSTSTKAVVMGPGEKTLGGFYTATMGDPVSAVKKLIAAIEKTWNEKGIRLLGVGTTGSGRKMIKELFGADLEVDEITAHARAAVHLYPQVDTLLEIGGQDSKFTRIHKGEVYYSTMNYVCAAGTGSFIEEQARRLGVRLLDFSTMAMGASAPYTSDRCTVYMERDLGALLGEGWKKEELAAAVLNCVRDNYLARVVNRSPMGEFIVFQGATARNAALVAAFENFLQKPIHVSPYCHLTGALGTALLCQEAGLENSFFRWDIQKMVLQEEPCELCANRCLLTVVLHPGKKTAWGMKCGREYTEPHIKRWRESAPRKRFDEAMKTLFWVPQGPSSRKGITLAVPNTLYNVEYLPLWHNFLTSLGFTVSTPSSSRKSLAVGKGIVNSDFCAPMVLAHGCLQESTKCDFLFFPALVNEKDPDGPGKECFAQKSNDAYFCYYSQYLPTLWEMSSPEEGKKLISPLIYFNHKTPEQIAGDIHAEMKKTFPDLERDEVGRCFSNAYEEFLRAKKEWARAYERSLQAEGAGEKIRVVLLGRPYVVLDPVLSLHIPQKIEEMGAEVFWQDEFEIENETLTYANQFYERMHWQYGKKIVRLAEYCARQENLFAVYLTCFRCSPDSFLISYIKDIMAHYDKPFLVLQLDEHNSDVGYTTRLEAGLRSFENCRKRKRVFRKDEPVTRARNDRLEKGDIVLISYLDSLVSQLWADCFTRVGYKAILLDANEKSLSTGYRYASGGECMSLVSIVGSVVEKVKNEGLDPSHVFFYMPTVCMACNFPQFPIFADLAFRSAGIGGVKIGLINSVAPGDAFPMSLSMKLLESNIIGCILYKLYHRVKPYEIEKGSANFVLSKGKQFIREAILGGKNLQAALGEVVAEFKGVPRDESRGRKPRIGLLGDLYVKYNEVVNQKIQSLVGELGGELIIPSITEYAAHFFEADTRIYGGDPRNYELMRRIERRYEKLTEGILGEELEPDLSECTKIMEEYDIRHYIAGETTINVSKALYYLKKKQIEALIHINPMFCCPGVVTSSIYRKLQEDFHVPIVDIFYDGTGNPNNVIIPHLHYLKEPVPK